MLMKRVLTFFANCQPPLINLCLCVLIILPLNLFVAFSAYSSGQGDSLEYHIHGRLVNNDGGTCVVNNGRDIFVNFGNVPVKKLDDENEIRVIMNYTLSCPINSNRQFQVSFSVTGQGPDSIDFDTNVPGLVMNFVVDGEYAVINGLGGHFDPPLNIDPSHPPKIEVAMTYYGDAPSDAQQFNASALMTVIYF
jgi:type 1 fimbria pilin